MKEPYQFGRLKLIQSRTIVSKPLADNKISHEEFLLIQAEFNKYYDMRRFIRERVQKASGECQTVRRC